MPEECANYFNMPDTARDAHQVENALAAFPNKAIIFGAAAKPSGVGGLASDHLSRQ